MEYSLPPPGMGFSPGNVLKDPIFSLIDDIGEFGPIVPLPHSTISRYFNGAEFLLFCVFTVFLAMPLFFFLFKHLGYALKRENMWDMTHDMGNITLLLLWVYIFANCQVTFELTSFVSFFVAIMVLGFMTQPTVSPQVVIVTEHSCSIVGFILALISIKNHIYYHRALGEDLFAMEFIVPFSVVSWLGYRYYLHYLSQSNSDTAKEGQSDHISERWKVYLALSLLTQSRGWVSSIFTGFALGGFIHSILANGF